MFKVAFLVRTTFKFITYNGILTVCDSVRRNTKPEVDSDPLGLLNPIVVRLKIFFQEFCILERLIETINYLMSF